MNGTPHSATIPNLVVQIPLAAPPAWPDLASFLAGRGDEPQSPARSSWSCAAVSIAASWDRDDTGSPPQRRSHHTGAVCRLRGAHTPIFGAHRSRNRSLEAAQSRTMAVQRQLVGAPARRTGHHTHHVHPRGWISSACYIALPECVSDGRTDQGTLSFGQPGVATAPALPAEFSVRPQAGMLVLFPSYFWHGTVPFASDSGISPYCGLRCGA